MYRYGVQCSFEDLPERNPVLFRGTPEQVAAKSKEAGYDAIELFIRNPKEVDPNRLNSAAAENGLEYCGICTGLEFLKNHLCITSDDTSVRRAAIDRLKEHIDLGAALSCPVVVGTMRGGIPSWNERTTYLGRLTESVSELSGYAAKAGVVLLIENILQYVSNYLNTVSEVGDFIRSLGLENVQLHIDTHSMHMEEKPDPYAVVRRYADVLGYVHFSDSNRGYPGSGMIDFKSYFHALMDAGYQGYITSEYQPYPDGMEAAKRGLAYMKLLERAALIERMSIH